MIPGAVVFAIITLISRGFYGLDGNLYYLKILSFLSHHGETYYPNQSVNGMLKRALFNGKNLPWNFSFPPYQPIVYCCTLASSIIFMFIGLFWDYKSKNPGILSLCIVILCATMASPIAWEHHYGIVMPIFVILSPFVLQYYSDKKWTLALLVFAYLLVSQYLKWTDLVADTHWNFLQSYLFFGACIILYFFLKISRTVGTVIPDEKLSWSIDRQ